MRSTARRRGPFSLLAALLLHAAAFALARAVPPRPLELSAFGPHFDRPGELFVDVLPREPASSPLPPRVVLSASPPEPAPRVTPLSPRAALPAPAPSEENPPPPAPPSAAPSDYDGPPDEPPRPGALPALAGRPVWAIPGAMPAPAATAPAPIRPTAAGVLAGNTEPAMFPAAGTLASAIAEGVRSSSTSPESDSTFLLTLDARGQLAAVEVVVAKGGDRKEWERIARAVKEQLGGRVFPMPSAFSGGGRIFVSVKSRLTMPDGTANGIPTPKPALIGKGSSIITLPGVHDDRLSNPMTTTDLPPDAIMIGIKFDFDIANVGAKRRRVVHTVVRAEPVSAAP